MLELKSIESKQPGLLNAQAALEEGMELEVLADTQESTVALDQPVEEIGSVNQTAQENQSLEEKKLSVDKVQAAIDQGAGLQTADKTRAAEELAAKANAPDEETLLLAKISILQDVILVMRDHFGEDLGTKNQQLLDLITSLETIIGLKAPDSLIDEDKVNFLKGKINEMGVREQVRVLKEISKISRDNTNDVGIGSTIDHISKDVLNSIKLKMTKDDFKELSFLKDELFEIDDNSDDNFAMDMLDEQSQQIELDIFSDDELPHLDNSQIPDEFRHLIEEKQLNAKVSKALSNNEEVTNQMAYT